MADDGDKITYELELKGASQMASQLDSVESRVNRLCKSVTNLKASFGPSSRMEKDFWEFKGLSKYRSKMYDLYSWKRVKNPNQWMSYIEPPTPAAKTHEGIKWIRELRKEMRGGDAADKPETKGSFYGVVPFRGIVPFKAASLATTETFSKWKEVQQRWKSMFEYGPNAGKDEAIDVDFEDKSGGKGGKRDSWWRRWDFSRFVPKNVRSFFGNFGKMGGAIGGFVGAVSIATIAFKALAKVVSTLFGPLKSQADEVFKFYRTRNMIGGAPGGLLSDFSFAGIASGGSAEEFRQLLVRIASERADLLWGGSGGSMMRAASRFGVDIRGTGERGMATEREWLRNIAVRMQQLPASGKLALANAAGLNREQMWMVSHGAGYYDFLTNQKTLGQMAWGGTDAIGPDIYSKNFQDESQDFWLDWAAFVQSFKELMGTVGEMILPLVSRILEVLTMTFEVLSLILKPIAAMIGKIFSLLNVSYWTNQYMMNNDASFDRLTSDYGLLNPANHPIITASITVGDMNVSSNATDSREVASLAVNQLRETLAESLYNSFGSLTGAA